MDGVPDRLLETDPLGSVASPTAKSLTAQTNTPSDNFYAEMLLKRLGAGPNKQGTTARGAGGPRLSRVRQEAASTWSTAPGLRARTRRRPRTSRELLTYMRKDESEKAAFFDSLAIAGKTGTLSRRMRNTAAEGRCHAKTGTITASAPSRATARPGPARSPSRS